MNTVFAEIWAGLFDEVRLLNDPFSNKMIEQCLHYKMITESQVALLLEKVADSVKPKKHIQLAYLEGERYTKELTCVRVKSFPNRFKYNDVTFLMVLEDAEGYQFNYWGSSDAIPEVGETAKITFTASGIKEFNGREAVIIKRPKAAK